MGKRYEVTKTDKMIGDTQVWLVRDQVGTGDEQAAWDYATNVWRQADGTCRCTKCSGPLTAMLSSCAHALAVKRFVEGAARELIGQRRRLGWADQQIVNELAYRGLPTNGVASGSTAQPKGGA